MKLERKIPAPATLDSALLRATTLGQPHDCIDVIADFGDGTGPIPDCVGAAFEADAQALTSALGRRPRILTGTVRRNQIELLAKYVVRAQAAYPVFGQMRDSLPEIGLEPDFTKRQHQGTPSGRGVVIGIIDDGCDWAHRNFRDSKGKTRVAFLWDQTPTTRLPPGRDADPSPPPLFGYGREFKGCRLDDVLVPGSSDEAYRRTGYALELGAHGTAVMDVAAGDGSAFPTMPGGSPSIPVGVAHEATIVFVQLPRDVAERADRLGHSRYVLDAVRYVFAKANELKMPAVVNLSLGGTHGPHDGTTLLETALDDLLDSIHPNSKARAIVAAAGNAGESRLHATGRLRSKVETSLVWCTGSGDPTPNQLELWHLPESTLEMWIQAPDGERIGPFARDHGTHIEDDDGREIGWVCRRSNDPGNGLSQIHIALSADAPSGNWSAILKHGATHDLGIDAWITRDDRGTLAAGQQARFVPGQAGWTLDTCTIATPGSAKFVFAVGGYTIHRRLQSREAYSGVGPTRDHPQPRRKPEFYAPLSVIVGEPEPGLACASARETGSRKASGTSIAVPHVTGLIAILFQKKPEISTSALRARLEGHVMDPDFGKLSWPL